MNTSRYFVTGWSKRFCCWMPEVVETMSKKAAKERFTAKYPTLTKVKVYQLRSE